MAYGQVGLTFSLFQGMLFYSRVSGCNCEGKKRGEHVRRTFTHAAVILLFAGCSGAEFTSSGDEHDAQAFGDTSPKMARQTFHRMPNRMHRRMLREMRLKIFRLMSSKRMRRTMHRTASRRSTRPRMFPRKQATSNATSPASALRGRRRISASTELRPLLAPRAGSAPCRIRT